MKVLIEPNKLYTNSNMSIKVQLPSYSVIEGEGTNVILNGTSENRMIADLYGNTTQNGTPTPSTPIDVEVVTGYNEVVVSNKNLLDVDDSTRKFNNNTLTLTTSNRNGFSVVGTTNATYFNTNALDFYLPKGTYTISSTNNDYNFYFWIRDITNTATYANVHLYKSTKTFTIDEDAEKIVIGIESLTSGNTYDIETYFQLEKGSQATDYIQHQEQEYEINLGKNLLPNVLNVDGTTILQTRCTMTLDGDTYNLMASGADAYWGNTVASGSAYNKNRGALIEIPSNATNVYLKLTNSNFAKNFVTWYDSSKTSLGYQQISGSLAIRSGAKYLSLRIGINSPTIGETYTTGIMVAFEDTDYAPYFTPIELCKIGNYQDKIYRNNGRWYLHKEVGKVIFDGSTNAFGYSTSNAVFVTDTLVSLIKKNTTMLTNYYSQISNSTSYANMANGQIKLDGTNSGRIIIKDTNYTDTNSYKTWLSNNNVTLYYVLNESTDTEITTASLAEELDDLRENMTTYTGQTNINQINSDLPFYLKIKAKV